MISTGAAIADPGAHDTRAFPQSRPAPVYFLPQRRPTPPRLLELLKKLDARAPSPLPGEKKSDHYWNVSTCAELFYPARCGCGKRLLPRTCGDRLCPHCERRRAAKAVAKYEACFQGRPWVRHLVFTVKRWQLGELAESIDFTNKALRKLRHSALCRDFLEGGTTALETKGKKAHGDDRGGWHTHAHMLAWGRGWVPIAALALKWVQVTGGRVDWRKFRALPESVQRASAGTGHLDAILSTAEESPLGCVELFGRGRVVHASAVERDRDGGYRDALREALKYVTKSPAGAKAGDDDAAAGWSVEMAREFYDATGSRRLFNKFGDCPKVGKLEAEPCERCGETIARVGGFRALFMNRDDAERWAGELEAGQDEDGLWTDAQLAAAAAERAAAHARHYGSPSP